MTSKVFGFGEPKGHYISEIGNYYGPCRVELSFRESRESFVVPSVEDARSVAEFACNTEVGGYSSVVIRPAPTEPIPLADWTTWAFSCNALEEYEHLLRYERMLPMPDAYEEGRNCKTSGIYAHYAMRSAIEPFVSGVTNFEIAARCLDAAYETVDAAGSQWTCIYVGRAAISKKGRTLGKRLRHEFGLRGRLGQAPALHSLCAVLDAQHRYEIRRRGRRNYLDLANDEKQRFLRWCEQNLRCVWQPIDVPQQGASQKVSQDEAMLIRELKPLLNIMHSVNPFCPFLKEARQRFDRKAV